VRDKKKEEAKIELQFKSLQSVGQIVGETLKQLTEEKCKQVELN